MTLPAFPSSAASLLPRVDTDIDPARSYWLDHVHYPWPHRMAAVEDGRHRVWQIAYVDLYEGPGDREQAPTLVLLHGRGMNSAYWGELLTRPLAAGWRIIAIDMPHSGKSLPGNLHLPPNRTLADIRQVVFNLVVGKLGIDRASYLGHSLGGQVLAGYALDHPGNVERLVLYAPAGIELVHPVIANGVRIDDPAFGEDFAAFNAAWEGVPVATMGRSVEAIENSFYAPLRPGTGTYLQRGDPLGEFIVASRTGILRGNPAELQRTIDMYRFDVFASFTDSAIDNPQSLPRRLPHLQVPTLFVIGLDETIYLMPATGNSDLIADVVDPLWQAARKAGSAVDVKLYPNGSHLMHVALHEPLSCDILRFLEGGRVGGLWQGPGGGQDRAA